MKESELQKSVLSGKCLCVGQYVSGRLDTVNYRDKKNGGEQRTATVAREVILGDADPLVVSRWLKDDEDPKKWAPSANRGDRVVVFITGMNQERGGVVVQGTIERLTS